MNTSAKTQRLAALDVFRGLTIIWMIIVNSPGTYGQLSHAYWDGLTIADFIFPFFIFISGVTIAFHCKNLPTTAQDKNSYYVKVLRRTAILFALGMAVNLIYTQFSAVRIAGVLQRIAIVYCVCSILILHFRTKQLIWISAAILFFYWLFLLFVPAPGLEAGVLERGKNIANWMDAEFLPGMLWRGSWDPEGLASTFPSIVTGLIGVLAGQIIIRSEGLSERINLMFIAGFLALFIGYVWSFFFLFNKALWSSSFVLVTGGCACLLLAVFMWTIDLKGMNRLNFVPTVFGTNAIAAYVLHVIFEKSLDIPHKQFMASATGAGLPEDLATFIWISAFIGLCFIPIYIMYKKRIFVKI